LHGETFCSCGKVNVGVTVADPKQRERSQREKTIETPQIKRVHTLCASNSHQWPQHEFLTSHCWNTCHDPLPSCAGGSLSVKHASNHNNCGLPRHNKGLACKTSGHALSSRKPHQAKTTQPKDCHRCGDLTAVWVGNLSLQE